jgi:hypothetical protein
MVDRGNLRGISDREIEIARAAIQKKYGFVPPDIYIVDLIRFVEAMTQGRELPALAKLVRGQEGPQHAARTARRG